MDNVARPSMSRNTFRRIVWALIALGGIIIGFTADQYLSFNPSVSRIPANPVFSSHFMWVAFHAIPAGLLLILGPFQFVPAIRRRYPAAHRTIGRIYLICVLLASITAVPVALMSTSGLPAQVGFLLLAVGWVYTGSLAYLTIRRGHIQLHRIWMIRNYALSFAAVWLRLFIFVGITAMQTNPSLTFDSVYTTAVWASIVVSYVVAEWFIVQRVFNPLVRNASTPAQPVAHA